jgi:CBS domain-containing protein
MTSNTAITLVKDLMITNVATISPLATIREAMKEMRRSRVKSLIVEKTHPHDAYGIITYTSIVKTIVADEEDVDLTNVYDICSKPVISVYGDMEIKYVARLMIQQSIQRVVVLDGNELVGIVSMSDIISAILENVE